MLMGKTKVSWVSCRCFLPKNLTMESDHGAPSPPPPRLRLTSAAAYAAQQLPQPKNLPTTYEIIKTSMQIHPYNLHLEPKKNIWCVYTLGYKLVGSYVNDQFRCSHSYIYSSSHCLKQIWHVNIGFNPTECQNASILTQHWLAPR